MKVLLIPFDIASKGPITLDALNRIEGIEAKGIFFNGNDTRTARSKHAQHYGWVPLTKNPAKWFLNYLKKSYHTQRLIRWADVLHWIWDSGFEGNLDLKFVSLIKKPGIIEWSGSDIRYPERNFQINPYAGLLYNGGYEFKDIETAAKSFKRQKKFSKLGFTPLVTPEMDLYIRKDLFPKTHITLHRLNVKDFRVSEPGNPRPLVVHSPTRRIAKGSQYILEAVEELKKDFDFDFRLLEGIPRGQVLKLVQDCDIFIDQLLLGSNGMAACEAMSMGKPVLCYIMPAVFENGLPPQCPIVNTNPDNIKQNLAKLLSDESLRKEKGRLGRLYAEEYLDVDKKALELVEFYKEAINKKSK